LAKNRHYTNYGSGHRKVLRKARSNDLTWRLPLHPNERASGSHVHFVRRYTSLGDSLVSALEEGNAGRIADLA
jgi:hypothetical protein